MYHMDAVGELISKLADDTKKLVGLKIAKKFVI